MFTGLIEETGTIRTIEKNGDGLDITIEATTVLDDLSIDDSVAVNGCCQTVVAHDRQSFRVTAIAETLTKTTLGRLVVGAPVNLERAVRLGDRLGGHMVQGHVDTTGVVTDVVAQERSHLVTISFDPDFAELVIPVGSIAIDGISLTAARVEGSQVTVAIIPHTWQKTVIHRRAAGDRVNLEFDMIGKYVRNFINR